MKFEQFEALCAATIIGTGLIILLLHGCGGGERKAIPAVEGNTVIAVSILNDESHGAYILRDIEVVTGNRTYNVRYANIDVQMGDEITVERYDENTQLVWCRGEVLDVIDARRVWEEI